MHKEAAYSVKRTWLLMVIGLLLSSGPTVAEVLYDGTGDDFGNAVNLGILLYRGSGPDVSMADGTLSDKPGYVYIDAHGNETKCAHKDPEQFANLLEQRGLPKRGAVVLFHSCSAGVNKESFLNPLAENLKSKGYSLLTLVGPTGVFAATPVGGQEPYYGGVQKTSMGCPETITKIREELVKKYNYLDTKKELVDQQKIEQLSFVEWSKKVIANENIFNANKDAFQLIGEAGCFKSNEDGWVTVSVP